MPLTGTWNGMCELLEVVKIRNGNAELIPLVVLCGESKGAHHVVGSNND
jgi:hypothetical protein